MRQAQWFPVVVRGILGLGLLLPAASGAVEGDPVPDVDVTVEQNPGASIAVTVDGAAFDEVVLSGAKDFVAGLEPVSLPEGWSMTRDGKEVRLSGPAQATPTRLRLQMAKTRPKEVSYRIVSGGKVIVRQDKVVPRSVPPFEVKSSLQGLVYLPDDVRAGDTLSFKPASDAVPAGTWSLAGQVVDEFEESEWASAMAVVNKTRSNIKGMTARLPEEGLTLVPTDGSTCESLAPLAAMMVMKPRHERPDGKPRPTEKQRYDVARVPGPAPGGSVEPFDIQPLGAPAGPSKARHEPAMNAIRNLKAFYAVAPADEGAGISIKEKGIEVFEVSFSGDEVARKSFYESRSNTANRFVQESPSNTSTQEMALKSFYESRSNRASTSTYVATRGETTPDGCVFTNREPSDLEIARAVVNKTRSNIKGMTTPPPSSGGLSGKVYAVDVPEELSSATGLALQLHDLFGDLVVDVPRAPVEILPPRAPAETPLQPCIETATAFVQAKDAFCVCGTFPGPGAAWSLLLNERAMPSGSTLSTSATEVWLRFPESSAPGRYVVSGPADAGFAPTCRAITHLIEIRGEIDSTRLLRGETVPMRLTILGTNERVPVRLRNLTPAIIDIEGGLEQTVESSGAGGNTITRQVRALQRGNFNVEWTLAGPPCPCS